MDWWKECYYEQYKGLELKDRPDLQDVSSSIGVEVVRDCTKEDGERDGMITKLFNSNGDEKVRVAKRLEKLGCKISSPGAVHHPPETDSFDNINIGFGEKIKKLNGAL